MAGVHSISDARFLRSRSAIDGAVQSIGSFIQIFSKNFSLFLTEIAHLWSKSFFSW